MAQPVSLLRRSALAASAALLAAPATASETASVREYQAVKTRDGKQIHLTMYRKRTGGGRLPVLFLVHGSSMSALSSFDLHVPGPENYSMMTEFAKNGFDVWTMDHEGYGKSDRTGGNSDIASGVEDLKAAVEVVQRETSQTRYHFLGESSGALRAAAYAMVAPDRCGRLVLAAHTYTGKGSPTLAKRAEGLEFFKTHSRRPRDKAMIESIFTRDRPGTTDPAVPAALVKAELVYGDSVPTVSLTWRRTSNSSGSIRRVSCRPCWWRAGNTMGSRRWTTWSTSLRNCPMATNSFRSSRGRCMRWMTCKARVRVLVCRGEVS